jgi:TonB family protein
VPANPPAGDCDEVACILEKYARPCCARYKPSVPDPKPVGAIAASLDKNMIRSGVERVRPAIIRCGELSPGTKGTVKVAVSVNAAGTVGNVAVATSPDPTLGQCVANAVRRATFTKTQDGATFSYPFVF